MTGSRFHNSLRVEQVDWRGGRAVWITLAPLVYTSELLDTTIVVPTDFVTDLSSVPRLLLTWFVAGGRAPRPSLPHDYGYQTGTLLLQAGGTITVTRAKLDALFYEAMKADPWSGTNTVTRSLMWAGVRVGGWTAWRNRPYRSRNLNPEWSENGWPGGVEAP